MSTPAPDYTPPSSAEMRERQDEEEALRLLIAQRRLYRRAKRWLGLRWFGMVAIGLGAPVVSVTKPDLAVVAGGSGGGMALPRADALYLRSDFDCRKGCSDPRAVRFFRLRYAWEH